MTATIAEERHLAKQNSEEGMFAVFQGRNMLRFIIASWPKVTQQFVGLSVFNTYATYFCEYSNPLTCSLPLFDPDCCPLSSKRREQKSLPRYGHPRLCADPVNDLHSHTYGQIRPSALDRLPLRRDRRGSAMSRNRWVYGLQ